MKMATKTLSALEMERGGNYRISSGAVPSSFCGLIEDGFYYFSVNFITDLEDGLLIEDSNAKLWEVNKSQYVHSVNWIY